MSLHKTIIKLAMVGLFAVGWSGWGPRPVWAQAESKSVALSVGDIQEVSIAFAVKGYRVGDPDIARVEQMSEQKLRVVGVKEGNTDLQVTGEGGLAELFKISVGSSLDAVVEEVRKDLENIPGLQVRKSLGKAVIEGIVTKPEQWRYLKKTVLPRYGDRVVCMATFRPQDELLLKLKTDLEKAKFKVLEGGSKSDAPGSLSLVCSENNIFINGSVYSRGELDAITSIVSSYPWLKLKRDSAKDNSDDDCYAVMNVTVAPVMLEVDVAFVGVTDAEANQIGANLFQNGLMFVSSAAQIAGDKGHSLHGSGSYLVSSSLQNTLNAVASSGPARFKCVGHLTFKNDAEDWKNFQDGGTIEVPILGQNGGVGIHPIDYGLILKAKGGLTDPENAALDLEVEFSIPQVKGQSPAGPIFDLKRSRIGSTVVCPVGKTLILGGSKQLTEGISVTGTPILRRIPLVEFFFSEHDRIRLDRQLLILISPQIARAPTPAPPAVEQTIGTLEEANKPLSNLGGKKDQK